MFSAKQCQDLVEKDILVETIIQPKLSCVTQSVMELTHFWDDFIENYAAESWPELQKFILEGFKMIVDEDDFYDLDDSEKADLINYWILENCHIEKLLVKVSTPVPSYSKDRKSFSSSWSFYTSAWLSGQSLSELYDVICQWHKDYHAWKKKPHDL